MSQGVGELSELSELSELRRTLTPTPTIEGSGRREIPPRVLNECASETLLLVTGEDISARFDEADARGRGAVAFPVQRRHTRTTRCARNDPSRPSPHSAQL